jgi:Protein of unknown function (DUF2927)
MRFAAILSLTLAAACVPSDGADVSMNRALLATDPSAGLPPAMAGFGLQAAGAPARGNAGIARDFLELSFRMESGRSLPAFSRFEGPVTVRLTGDVPQSAAVDLERLLARLQVEADLDIRATTDPDASITVEFLPRSRIQATYANVACFVIPGVSDWGGFRARRNAPETDWETLVVRTRMAIFIPSDGPAQEARDCLHEELAQALGPVNDLFRLSDSVFNDDNFQNTLTGFDMLVLRATYAPELRAGMNEDQVAARLPEVLARLHPQGGGVGGGSAGPTPRQWTNAIEVALGGRSGLPAREQAARQAIAIAQEAGWHDARLALGYFALGRLLLTRDPDTALASFATAGRIYRSLPGGMVHAAHVEMQLAAYDLTQGDHARALARIKAVLPIVAQSENAALMATLLMMQAEALERTGHPEDAAAVRLDSLGWGRYGFGSDAQVRARMAEIAVLARRG